MIEVPDFCPNCGLVLLSGAIFDAAAEQARYGPILGLSDQAKPETAKAGYIGISSLWIYETSPEFYRCPRCGIDPIATAQHAPKETQD